ncbi:MAG: reverse transcriptase/maturase family protein [Oscillospiraceae bacterium]|nr:reverse transcriptase/maturase family protein [Oscillospiraceae bacterium]
MGIPSFDDKLVQEIVRMLLEAIYEPTFSNYSHGFRPNRSCHTALTQLQRNFSGARWFIEGDIKSFFDNIDHAVLIGILRRQIHDEYFIALIWKFLKAGYLEDWIFHRTYSGTPQGSIISPILSNIYLNELDRYIKQYMASFKNRAKRDKYAPYWKLHEQIRWLKKGKYKPDMWKTWTNQSEKRFCKKSAKKRPKSGKCQYTTPWTQIISVRNMSDMRMTGFAGLSAVKKTLKTSNQISSNFYLKNCIWNCLMKDAHYTGQGQKPGFWALRCLSATAIMS